MKRAASGVDAPGAALDAPHEPNTEQHPMSEDKAPPPNVETRISFDDLPPINIAGLEIHPLALAFPAYNKHDMAALAEDMRAHGMLQKITLFEGKVLDGRNRVEAAKQIGLMFIPIDRFQGTFEQARAYVISLNMVRRDLTTSQKARIAASLARMRPGRPSKGAGENPQNCGLSTKAAAEQLKVSPRSIETAKAIQEADPALAEEVKQGRTKLSTAVRNTAALKALPKVATA
jgi:ParB-like chromosome segregation protein Spo0J